MNYPSPLVQGTFVRRYKRFLCDVILPDGTEVTAHVANTGAMTGCTAPDAPVRLSHSSDPKRKLAWSVEQIRVGGHWICVNTARPNRVVEEGIEAGRVPELAGYPTVRREQRLGESRVDLLLEGDGPRCWVEVKNATLLDGDRIVFPDARTARGTRHVGELEQAVRAGDRAVLFFHVGHEGGASVGLAEQVDPDYAAAVRSAVGAGVEVLAWRAAMTERTLALSEAVPVSL